MKNNICLNFMKDNGAGATPLNGLSNLLLQTGSALTGFFNTKNLNGKFIENLHRKDLSILFLALCDLTSPKGPEGMPLADACVA
jgi:hypothetical protein